jgi:hypothetical protein
MNENNLHPLGVSIIDDPNAGWIAQPSVLRLADDGRVASVVEKHCLTIGDSRPFRSGVIGGLVFTTDSRAYGWSRKGQCRLRDLLPDAEEPAVRMGPAFGGRRD